MLIAIVTTRDTEWWHLHFSQLGTHDDFSGRMFNSTLLVTGLTLVAYAIVMGADLPRVLGRRRQNWVRLSLASAGAHMSVVGLIPIPVDPVMHDLAALGLVASFAAVLASTLGCRGFARSFRRFGTLGFIVLLLGISALFSGFITLAAYEAVSFGTMCVWILALPRGLRASSTPARRVRAHRSVMRRSPRATTRPKATPALSPARRPGDTRRVTATSPRTTAVVTVRHRKSTSARVGASSRPSILTRRPVAHTPPLLRASALNPTVSHTAHHAPKSRAAGASTSRPSSEGKWGLPVRTPVGRGARPGAHRGSRTRTLSDGRPDSLAEAGLQSA